MEKLTLEKPLESDFSDLDNLFKILNGFDLRTKVADMREKVQQAYQTRLNVIAISEIDISTLRPTQIPKRVETKMLNLYTFCIL